MDLRETIDSLRAKNEEAQAVIHGALNNPENTKGLSFFSVHFFLIYIYVTQFYHVLRLSCRPTNPTPELL